MEATVDRDIINYPYSEFEQAYIRLRRSENRIFSDADVLQLPDVTRKHPHYKEWKLRKRSAKKLSAYLISLNKHLTILEVGCGNGWLSAHLAQIPQIEVTGIDVNLHELDQARRLFGINNKLKFINSSIEQLDPEKRFDIILFASSIQYFPSLQSVIIQSHNFLNPNGEIHILDTMFYKGSEVEKAKKRSSLYFESTGHTEMTGYYYHHKIEDLHVFNVSILTNPLSILNKLLKPANPFYWIRIKP